MPDSHPFLTPRGLRLQQLGRVDQSSPRIMPEYTVPQSPPRPPGTPRPSPSGVPDPWQTAPVMDPFEFESLPPDQPIGVIPSRRYPDANVLTRMPLAETYHVAKVSRPQISGDPSADGVDPAKPLAAVGKLFLQTSPRTDRGLATGSAWVVGPDTIATAAHNLFDSNSRTWTHGLRFHAAFDYYAERTRTPPPVRITAGSVPRRYLENPTTDADIAVCKTEFPIGDILGVNVPWLAVDDIEFYETHAVAIVGYPGTSGFDFGKQMWRSVGQYLFARQSSPGADPTPGMASSMGSGVSGGPWIVDVEDGYRAVGVTSGHAKLHYVRGEHSLESLTTPMLSSRLIDQLQSDAVWHSFDG